METKNVVTIDKEKCTGCGLCCKNCPVHVLTLQNGKATVESDQCLKCGHCIAICPKDAFVISGYDMKEVQPYDEKNFGIDENI